MTARALLPILVGMGLLGYAASVPDRPPVVACVDLEKVYLGLESYKAADAARETLRAELTAKVDALRAELGALEDDLGSFRPGSDAYQEASRRALDKAGELNALQGFIQLKLEAHRAIALREAYLAVKAAAASVAQEHHLDILFVDDSIPPVDPADFQGTMQQINGRRMLFSNPALDISDLLVAKANEAFAAAKAP